MGFGTNKLRIVWICHFMNKTIQELLGMDGNEKEYAPWISLGIEEIKKRNDIELHVIAPFYKILKKRKFTDKNVHYHCIKVGIPFLRTAWPAFFTFDIWTNFFMFNLQVKNLIKRIKPDLINLQGAENAYYSSSILCIKGYPILVTIQGFISLHNQQNGNVPGIRKRLQIEENILRKEKYYGIEASFMEEYLLTFNPMAKIYWYHCPFSKTEVVYSGDKEYDLVYFATISKMKGIEDLIKAVSIVRTQKPEIKLCIIGKAFSTYINYLKKLIENLNLVDNIIFKGFIPTQKEMHSEVVKARISVLPTYNDTIPGTIAESMLLGVPVISYNTGGIPDLNKDGEHLIIVEQGNIDKLAFEIIELLSSTNKQKELAEKAKNYATIEFDNANSVNMMIKAYKDVILDYKNDH